MLKIVLRARIEDDYQIDAVMSSKVTFCLVGDSRVCVLEAADSRLASNLHNMDATWTSRPYHKNKKRHR
jgi:hypothetical protein